MKRTLLGLAAAASLAATAVAPASAQQWVPPGSYQQSCTNVRVSGNQLRASCTASNGARVRSSIALNACRGGDIANSNGQLICNGGGGYGYGNGYNNGRHRDRDDNGYNNGSYNNGSGYNNGRYNNGQYGNGYAPGGSYQQSCNNIRSNGTTVTASCPGPNGQWYTTSINARACGGADIANRNGRLSCG
jgi:hypothetical protein